MFKLILILSSAATVAMAGNSTSNDFGKYTGELKPLTPSALGERLQISGDIYAVDASGNKLLFRGPESRQWKFPPSKGDIESNWSAQIGDYPAIALRHVWTVGEDGVLRVKFQQFESMERKGEAAGDSKEVKFGKLVKEEERVVKDFSPVLWTAHETPAYRMVVRFIPVVLEPTRNRSIADFPIAGTNVLISDNQGHTWTEPMEQLNDKYIAFITHLGTIALSYYPFPGAKVIGRAKGGLLEVEAEKGLKVRLTSETPFMPGEMTSDVYGLYLKDRRSPRVSSTHVIGSSTEARFAENLGIKK